MTTTTHNQQWNHPKNKEEEFNPDLTNDSSKEQGTNEYSAPFDKNWGYFERDLW